MSTFPTPSNLASVTDDLRPCDRCGERGHECPVEFILTDEDGAQLWVRQARDGHAVLVDRRNDRWSTWRPAVDWTGEVAP